MNTIQFDKASILADIETKIQNNNIRLPSAPEMIMSVNRALNNDSNSMRTIADIIQRDGPISARILRVANSPVIRGRNPITTIYDAITRIGINMIKGFTVAASLQDRFKSTNVELTNKLQKIWDDSLTLGLSAYFYVKHQKIAGLNPDTAMTAGILYYIGALPIIEYYSQHLPSQMSELDYAVFELRRHINMNILTDWGIPTEIVHACTKDAVETPAINDYGDVLILFSTYINTKKSEAAAVIPKINITYRDLDDFMSRHAEAIESVKREMMGH